MGESNSGKVAQASRDIAKDKIVTGSGFSRKHTFWVATTAAVVVIGALGGWYYAHKVSQRVTINGLNDVQNRADASAYGPGGDVQAGLDVYNHAITNAADNTTRANLYLQAADLALSKGKADLALNYALKANTILHTPDSSSLVASIYQQKGNTAQAASYYRKAAAEVKPNQLSGNGKQYYLDKAAQATNGGAN